MAGALGTNSGSSGVTGDAGGGYYDSGIGGNSAQGGSSGFNPLGLALPIGAGIASWLGGQSTNDANSAEAAKNRDFAAAEAQKSREYDYDKSMWQSHTGYQNAVQDMQKAGLNPGLMYAGKGGMEQGTGGGPQASAPGNAQMQNAMGQGLSSALSSASLIQELRNSNADITMKQAQALNATANATYASSSAKQTNEATAQMEARRGSNKAEATRDAGDATWEDQNRTARMLTGKAGMAGAIGHSAKAGTDLIQWLANGAPAKNMREAQALRDAGISGIPVQRQRGSDYYKGYK